jgi:hypothetical protein
MQGQMGMLPNGMMAMMPPPGMFMQQQQAAMQGMPAPAPGTAPNAMTMMPPPGMFMQPMQGMPAPAPGMAPNGMPMMLNEITMIGGRPQPADNHPNRPSFPDDSSRISSALKSIGLLWMNGPRRCCSKKFRASLICSANSEEWPMMRLSQLNEEETDLLLYCVAGIAPSTRPGDLAAESKGACRDAARKQHLVKLRKFPMRLQQLTEDCDNVAGVAMKLGYSPDWLSDGLRNHWIMSRQCTGLATQSLATAGMRTTAPKAIEAGNAEQDADEPIAGGDGGVGEGSVDAIVPFKAPTPKKIAKDVASSSAARTSSMWELPRLNFGPILAAAKEARGEKRKEPVEDGGTILDTDQDETAEAEAQSSGEQPIETATDASVENFAW